MSHPESSPLVPSQSSRVSESSPPLRGDSLNSTGSLESSLPGGYVELRHGLLVSRESVDLALDLERRGFRQTVDRLGCYQIEPGAGLSDSDRSRIARWSVHLAAIVSAAQEAA